MPVAVASDLLFLGAMGALGLGLLRTCPRGAGTSHRAWRSAVPA